MWRAVDRETRAKLALMQDADLTAEHIRTVDRSPEQHARVEYEMLPDTASLEKAIDDWLRVPGYLSMIADKKVASTFRLRNHKGIRIKTKDSHALVLLSTGKLAEIALDRGQITRRSNVIAIDTHKALEYGNSQELARLLDQSISVVNEFIQNKHKRRFPKLYFGDWYGVSDDDLRALIDKQERERLASAKAELARREAAANQQVGPSN